MKVSPARAAAFDVLTRVEAERAFSSVLLPIFESDLRPLDRGLCHELVLGVLRRQMWLDRVIDAFVQKKLDPEVRLALRLGIFQLVFLDKIPDHSAINETVNLAQRAKKTSAKGLVNAVLRRVSKGLPVLEFHDDVERIAVEMSHPRWLIERWLQRLGPSETEDLAKANNSRPAIAFRVIDQEAAGVNEVLQASKPSEYVENCFLAKPGTPEIFELAAVNAIYIQDEGSQLIASAINTGSGEKVLDVCAAPGGKTGMIALARPEGLVAAGDLHWKRVQFLRENCLRQGAGNVKVVQYDAAIALPFAAETFDAVLVDAPCSGTGTIRNNPEIRYFLAADDLKELRKKQSKILKNAAAAVKPGGQLIYSTCSLEPEENEHVCEQFLRDGPFFEIVKPRVPEHFITSDGFARTWPHRDAMDGFFIAAFQRRF
nr:ribosomal RNA small subunit methyltransferase B [uncultured bacterium]